MDITTINTYIKVSEPYIPLFKGPEEYRGCYHGKSTDESERPLFVPKETYDRVFGTYMKQTIVTEPIKDDKVMIDYEHILGEQLEVEPDLITPEVEEFFAECVKMTKLYAKKNHDYGNSFAKGVKDIGNVYAIGRLYDKMNRLINLTKTKARVEDESIEDTCRDLACYAVMFLNAYKDIHKKNY